MKKNTYFPILFWLNFFLVVLVCPGQANAESSRLALFITGLSGSHAFEANFQKASQDFRTLLLRNGYAQADLVKFTEEKSADTAPLWGKEEISTRKNILEYLETLGRTGTSFDNVFIFISGHANGRDDEAVLHLPGDDLIFQELITGIQNIPAKKMMIVAATSQGQAWIEKLSGPGRVIIAGNGLREFDSIPLLFLRTFPEMFEKISSEGHTSPEKKIGPSDSVTLRDVFAESQRRMLQWYRNNRLHMTEIALIDVDGDKKGESFLRPETLESVLKEPGKIVAPESAVSNPIPEMDSFPMDFNLPDAQMAEAIQFLTPKGDTVS